MRSETVRTDVTVIGGGLAGVCAAIAAARAGREVALVQNRPMLGGNSSSEVRVWVCGATAHGRQRNARETGIMGELYVENQFRNPDGNPYYWDLVVLEAVRAEPRIQLFLNTDVREVEADGPDDRRTVTSVTGWMMGSERLIRFESPAFIDCTGDGLVGFIAGATYRIGRESSSEYGEPWAPEIPDDITLGSTMLFYTKDAGHPVKYVPPSFAIDVTETAIPTRRIIRSGDNGCAYWWIEWGGELDTVHENERIRDELWAVIYGIWDYIKNSGNFDADTMTLEWVGSIPGKREYRRFTGDYTMTQHDVLGQTPFEDRIAFGGWSIDLHPPGGVYAEDPGSKHWHSDGVYHIPLRSLFSVNVANLWFAGRNISASHVAFGTTRVMATCAVVGEAAGAAAAYSIDKGVPPRQIAREHVGELQQRMLRADASLLGIRNEDADDLARTAQVSASSTFTTLSTSVGAERWVLEKDAGVVVPVDPEIEQVAVLVEATGRTELEVELFDTSHPQNYVPHKRIAVDSRVIEPTGDPQWISFDLGWQPDIPRNAFMVIKANAEVALLRSNTPEPGVLCFEHRPPPPDADYEQLLMEWPTTKGGGTFSVRVTPETKAYAPERAVGGYHRPYGGPQLWASDAPQAEEWLRLDWPEPISVGQVELVFDDDVNEYLINLHHYRTPHEVLPTLVRDYRVEVMLDGSWRTVADVCDNRWRRRVHRPEPVTTGAMRVVVTATNGAPRAHIVSVRAYGPAADHA